MKRFIVMSILLATVVAFGSQAATLGYNNALKYESSFTIPSVEFSAYDVVNAVEVSSQAEAAIEEVNDFHPPTAIMKNYNSEFHSNYFKPPVKKTNDNLLPDIRRLSWVSVVAGSNRHI